MACCFIVPPYLLESIADSHENGDDCRQHARATLEQREEFVALRQERLDFAASPPALRSQHPFAAHQQQSIIPEDLLRHIANSQDVDADTRRRAQRDADQLASTISTYQAALAGEDADAAGQSLAATGDETEKPGFYRAVYDAEHVATQTKLPGTVARVEGQAAVTDAAVNEAYENVGRVLNFYLDKFGWRSVDNKNMHAISTVHFGNKYGNAFWDPSRQQMVFGDGDTFLHKFTSCIDVIGHEMTHAVVEYTSPLLYWDQSGALNEHVADTFGIMVKQLHENEKAADADWLIGEGCLLPDIKGVALRNMANPGTAYDDPRLGKDPQPSHFKDYKKITRDNGGVHIYSGIPNRAFYLASVAFGGYSWEKAGRIWWKTMNSGKIPSRCTFIQFADVTVEEAEEEFGAEAAKIVRKAWEDVGVTRKH